MLSFEYAYESNNSLNTIPTTDSSTAVRVVEKHEESINIPNDNLEKLARVVEKHEEVLKSIKYNIEKDKDSGGNAEEEEEGKKTETTVAKESFWVPYSAPVFVRAATDIRKKVATPLPRELHTEPVLFVHVGKAGGSSLRDVIVNAHNTCQKSISNNNNTVVVPAETSNPYHCSMARMFPVNERMVHIWNGADRFPNFTQYLLPIRNPIDRLVSWFNFDRVSELALKRRHEKSSYPIATTFHTCFNTINDVITAVLLELLRNLSSTPYNSSFSQYFHNNTKNCLEVGRLCLMGIKHCAHHNLYNNEYYMENLVHWKICHNQQQQQKKKKNKKKQNHDVVMTKNNKNNNCTARNIRIDVIRTEHPDDDLNNILELWTGIPRNSTVATRDGIGYHQLNSHEQTESRYKFKEHEETSADIDPTKYISPEGVKALCREICPELLVYKAIVALADNLNYRHVVDAYQTLDATCLGSVDNLCGTEFQYRNKKKKAWAETNVAASIHLA